LADIQSVTTAFYVSSLLYCYKDLTDLQLEANSLAQCESSGCWSHAAGRPEGLVC